MKLDTIEDHQKEIAKMNDFGKNVMMHRYLYYVLGQPVISDWEYDKLEDEASKQPENDYLNHAVGSDTRELYSREIRCWNKTDIWGKPRNA